MKKTELLSLIREELKLEMAAIASGLKLADNWKELWETVPESIKLSTRYKRIIDFLEENGTGTLKDIAIEKFNSTDTAVCNQLVKRLKELGIVESTGYVREPKYKEKTTTPGAFGRPKLTDENVKMLGLNIVRKFSKGLTDFTDEEKELIQNMYNSIK